MNVSLTYHTVDWTVNAGKRIFPVLFLPRQSRIWICDGPWAELFLGSYNHTCNLGPCYQGF